jgi:hypothetical protein
MEKSLLAHEIGHAVSSLLALSSFGYIAQKESGAIFAPNFPFEQSTPEDRARIVVTGLTAGFFLEIMAHLPGQSPKSIFTALTGPQVIPDSIRYGLSSRHASESDLAVLANRKLEDFREDADLGYLIGLVLHTHPAFMADVCRVISEDNHLLLCSYDAMNLVQGDMPTLRIGNGEVWNASGKIMSPSDAQKLSQLMIESYVESLE